MRDASRVSWTGYSTAVSYRRYNTLCCGRHRSELRLAELAWLRHDMAFLYVRKWLVVIAVRVLRVLLLGVLQAHVFTHCGVWQVCLLHVYIMLIVVRLQLALLLILHRRLADDRLFPDLLVECLTADS